MLTEELIKKSVSGLTDEQVKSIVELSKNDENTVIATKIGEIYGGLDKDILEVSGVEKNSGEKTYDYAKRVIAKLKKGSPEIEEKLKALEAEKTDLEKKLKASAGDDVLKQKLADTEKRLSDLQAKYEADINEWKTKVSDIENKTVKIRVENEFDKALMGLRFKDEKIIPPAVRDAYIQNAKSAILSELKPDFIDDGKGGRRLIFRDADGQIKNNPENKLNPYTAQELIQERVKDILDFGKKQNGAGSNGKHGGQSTVLDLSGVGTQLEADEKIQEYLLRKGLTKDNPKFAEEQAKIREENKVVELPIR